MTPRHGGLPGRETLSLDAESLRRARLGVWEDEGGGLGTRRPPPNPGAEVGFDGVRITATQAAKERR